METSFTLLGYSGLAMILLTLAGIGAAYLAIQIVRHDRTTRPR